MKGKIEHIEMLYFLAVKADFVELYNSNYGQKEVSRNT
jgi:hypothetical protein